MQRVRGGSEPPALTDSVSYGSGGLGRVALPLQSEDLTVFSCEGVLGFVYVT